jgi:hypothetical protein
MSKFEMKFACHHYSAAIDYFFHSIYLPQRIYIFPQRLSWCSINTSSRFRFSRCISSCVSRPPRRHEKNSRELPATRQQFLRYECRRRQRVCNFLRLSPSIYTMHRLLVHIYHYLASSGFKSAAATVSREANLSAVDILRQQHAQASIQPSPFLKDLWTVYYETTKNNRTDRVKTQQHTASQLNQFDDPIQPSTLATSQIVLNEPPRPTESRSARIEITRRPVGKTRRQVHADFLYMYLKCTGCSITSFNQLPAIEKVL